MKKCKVEGCNSNVWSGDTCRRHTSYKPLQAKKKEVNEDINLMKKFFLEVWNKHREHICESCGKPLGNTPSSYMFDHILEKQKYPQLKFEEENIQYLCLHCHDEKTRGFITEKISEKINLVRKKFNIFV